MERIEEIANIKIDLSVILKVIKHAKQANFKLACGQLHGIYQNKSIEISNCYAIPTGRSEDQADGDDTYDMDMISKLEEVNLDNNKVGWYQVSYANDHITGISVEALFDYHKSLPYAIYLVYDILEAERGSKTPFKVYRFNPKLLEKLTREAPNQRVNPTTVKTLNYKLDKIFEEVPVEIIKSPLAKAWLYEQKRALKSKFAGARTGLQLNSYFERTIQFLSDSLEEQTALDLKNNQDTKKGEKKEEKKLDMSDFIESFASRHRINNFTQKVNDCGKLELDNCQVLSHFYQIKF